MSEDLSDSGVKPWTIRGIAPEERNAAGEAAKRAGMNLGEWLSRAIRAQIQSDNQASRAPVPAEADSQTALSDVERIAASFRDLAAAGVPVSKTHYLADYYANHRRSLPSPALSRH